MLGIKPNSSQSLWFIERYDMDSDGCLSKNETAEWLEDEFMSWFDSFDADSNGKIFITLRDNIFNVKLDFFQPRIEFLAKINSLPQPLSYLVHDDQNDFPESSWTKILTNI